MINKNVLLSKTFAAKERLSRRKNKEQNKKRGVAVSEVGNGERNNLDISNGSESSDSDSLFNIDTQSMQS